LDTYLIGYTGWFADCYSDLAGDWRRLDERIEGL